MAWIVNDTDVTAIVRAVQNYSRACVVEAKLPAKAIEARRDAHRQQEEAWQQMFDELEKLTTTNNVVDFPLEGLPLLVELSRKAAEATTAMANEMTKQANKLPS